MALNKKDCIAAVKQAGASELEALDIVDMLLEQKARLKASGDLTPQNLSRAWSATAEGLARQRAIQRRRTALGLVNGRHSGPDGGRFPTVGRGAALRIRLAAGHLQILGIPHAERTGGC